MTVENQEKTDTGTSEGSKAEPKTETTKAETKVEAKPPSSEAKDSKAEDKKEAPKGPQPLQLSEDDDEIPEDAELLQLSKAALSKRLARHTKKELRARFGTDDAADIKAKLDRLDEFETKAEEERRKQLTREQQLQEDLENERKARTKAEKAYERTVEFQTFSQFDQAATSAIAKHFEPGFEDYAIVKLKAHVSSLDDEDAPRDAKKAAAVFDKWAEKYVKENPKFARAQEKEKEPEKREVKKVTLTNGADPHRPERGEPNDAKKTPRPGLKNTMSKAEYANFKRQNGLT